MLLSLRIFAKEEATDLSQELGIMQSAYENLLQKVRAILKKHLTKKDVPSPLEPQRKKRKK